MRRSVCGPICRSRARVVSAAPVGPRSSVASSRCGATTRWRRTRSTPATSSPASRWPSRTRWSSTTTREGDSVQLGLHLPSFTYPNGPSALGSDLARIATAAEDAGFTKLSVMDHVWQIGVIGPPEQEMLEAYTTLGFLAAHTKRIDLLAWVTAVVYREPGLLAKCISTLDVLSGGRAWLGGGGAGEGGGGGRGGRAL